MRSLLADQVRCCIALVAAVALCACASAKPLPPPPPLPPAGPIVFGKVTAKRPTFYELRFTPDRAYEGLELHFELLDDNKQVVHSDKMQVGIIFEGRRNALARGRAEVRRLQRPADAIKVVGRRRTIRSHHDAPEINLGAVRSARLVHVFRCARERYRWRPGLPIPSGVTQVPRVGTLYQRNACRAEADAPRVRRTFRFERRRSRTRGTLVLQVRFERDFPRGASFVLDLLDAAGKPVDAGCTYHVRQPKVYEGTAMDYSIEIQGARAASVLDRVKKVRYRALRRHAGPARELTLRRICR